MSLNVCVCVCVSVSVSICVYQETLSTHLLTTAVLRLGLGDDGDVVVVVRGDLGVLGHVDHGGHHTLVVSNSAQ